MQTLVVRLGVNEASRVQWLVFDAQENEIMASGVLDDISQLSSLKERAGAAQVIGLVPSCHVFFTHVVLPKAVTRKLATAIPFMIEDELCGDIQDMFFALGAKRGEQQEVGVVSKEQMHRWQHCFKEAGLFCTNLIPDAYCLPLHDDGISLMQLESELLARFDDGRILQGETQWCLPLISERLKQTPTAVHVFSELETELDAEVKEHYELLPLQQLLNGALSASLNLFQADFSVKRESNPIWKKWKVAAVLALVALGVNLGSKIIELNHLKSEREAVRAQIAQSVKNGFPDMGSYRFLRTAVEKQMLRLEQGGGNLSMLAMLSRLSNAFESSGVKPQNLRFDRKRSELRMQSVAANFESLERFKRDVQSLGFDVEQGAFNNRGDEVVGVIVVKG